MSPEDGDADSGAEADDVSSVTMDSGEADDRSETMGQLAQHRQTPHQAGRQAKRQTRTRIKTKTRKRTKLGR